jgi:hypothetical protein
MVGFEGSFTANVQMPVDEGRLDDWHLYVEGRERAYGFLGEEMVCVRRGTSWTSGNCTLRDGKEAMVRSLGYEMVCLCCVGRATAGRVAIVR